VKRDWVLTIAFLVFGFGAIAACGDGQSDSPEACTARGGQWYISSSTISDDIAEQATHYEDHRGLRFLPGTRFDADGRAVLP
jgi:hypothetical protein